MASNGTTTLQAYSCIGELVVDKFTSVSGRDLRAMFTPFEKKFKLVTKYPSNEGRYYKPVIDGIIVERVKECLMTLARTMIDPSLDVRTDPNKGNIRQARYRQCGPASVARR